MAEDQSPPSMVSVPPEALREVLEALLQPVSSPRIRELMATRNISELLLGKPNPIDVLVKAYNDWAALQRKSKKDGEKPS